MLKFLKDFFRRSRHRLPPADHQLPLLDLGAFCFPMRRVYLLTEHIRLHPDLPEKARALTLDRSRPNLGIKGRWGLFVSREWWRNVNAGKIEADIVTGRVLNAYRAGQDDAGAANTVSLQLADGSIREVGIYVNLRGDAADFKPGRFVGIVYALEQLKSGEELPIALEMAVSERDVLPTEVAIRSQIVTSPDRQ